MARTIDEISPQPLPAWGVRLGSGYPGLPRHDADPRAIVRVDRLEEATGFEAFERGLIVETVEIGETAINIQPIAQDIPVPGAVRHVSRPDRHHAPFEYRS